ncbi:hypothetical protein G6F55_013399 [Rhizopus delemar]|nr:hypothetical protein G6F55_013399 [Rhizopus delemar]
MVAISRGGWWKILRGPLPAGRAGGLWEHTQRLASWLFALRVWGGAVDRVRRMGGVRSGRPTNAGARRTKPIIDARHHDGLRASGHRTNDTRCPVGVVGVAARNLDAPEGIRREPEADEDDDGGVRSEGSGPQSWARAVMPTPPMGDLRSAKTSQKNEPLNQQLPNHSDNGF